MTLKSSLHKVLSLRSKSFELMMGFSKLLPADEIIKGFIDSLNTNLSLNQYLLNDINHNLNSYGTSVNSEPSVMVEVFRGASKGKTR